MIDVKLSNIQGWRWGYAIKLYRAVAKGK